MTSKYRLTIIFAFLLALSISVASAIQLDAVYVQSDPSVISALNEQKELQDNAHTMAEAARTLQASGVLEDHQALSTIDLAKSIWADSQEKIDELTKVLQSQQEVSISFAPHTPTNLTAAAFDKMLAGTSMAGTGEAFVKMEETTGTNALFAIGVANSESSFGAACYNNNPFGILSSGGLKYFSSWDAAIQYFGELIAGKTGVSSYKYASTIEAINAIYCPGDGYYWTSKVRSTMNMCLNKLA